MSQGYRGRNSTADRALDILLLFADDRLALTAGEVATHLGVARSTAYRYLQSLTSNGFLTENEDGGPGFRLGPRVLDLARLARKGVGLSGLARPVMRDLVRRTGHPALLTRRAGPAVVCLEREEAGHTLRLSYERGQVLPVNAGAAALVLLAWAPPATSTSCSPGRSPVSPTPPSPTRTRCAGGWPRSASAGTRSAGASWTRTSSALRPPCAAGTTGSSPRSASPPSPTGCPAPRCPASWRRCARRRTSCPTGYAARPAPAETGAGRARRAGRAGIGAGVRGPSAGPGGRRPPRPARRAP